MTDLEAVLSDLQTQGLYRELRVVNSAQGRQVVIDGADVLLMCSNDYLGLAGHRAVRTAAAEAALRWGAGAGGSRLVAGNMTLHRALELELATFKGYQACVLLGSGYLANLGIIEALAGRDEVILSDSLNHASIIDGCRQSRAETIVYRHGDLDALAHGLRHAGGRQSLIVTEAVFSMDGDLAPLQGIVELARRHGARLLVDEAHATGVVGPGGRGLVCALGLQSEVDVVIGTLSKALGSYGAFACCDETTADYLINRARTLIFSTALPPSAVAAAQAALQLVSEGQLVTQLWRNARLLRAELAGAGFAVDAGEMPIVALIVGDPRAALALSQYALDRGVLVPAIRPPTVPAGTSRLRVVTMATHTEADVRTAVTALADARDRNQWP